MKTASFGLATVVFVSLVFGTACADHGGPGEGSWDTGPEDAGPKDVSDSDDIPDSEVDAADDVAPDLADIEPSPDLADTNPDTSRCSSTTHWCNGRCVPDDSIVNCGSDCELCQGSSTGSPICSGGECKLDCDEGYRYCGGECVRCPSGAESLTCQDGSCVATACPEGRKLCGGTCPECPSNSEATTCNDQDACVATACQEDSHLCNGVCSPDDAPGSCGSRCTPCPSGPNSLATCTESYKCGFQCTKENWPCSPTGCCPWSRLKVTTAGDPEYFGMTLGPADEPHLVYLQYLNQTSSEVRYRNPVSGVSEAIATTTGNPTDLFNFAIDIEINPSTGQPVTTYRKGYNPQMLAERQPDGTWTKTALGFLHPLTKIFDLEYSGGDLHLLAFENGTNPIKLTYARRTNGTWSEETIATNVIEEWADMAIDSSGTVMVVYGKEDSTEAPIYGALRTGPGSWNTDHILDVNLANSGSVNADVDASTSGSFKVSLSYLGPNEPTKNQYYDLTLATFSNGTWSHSVVDERPGAGVQPDIEFDSTGKLFGHYQQFQNLQIGTFRNGAWRHSVVSSDAAPFPYKSSSLEIDSSDTPVVAYEKSSSGNLIIYR